MVVCIAFATAASDGVRASYPAPVVCADAPEAIQTTRSVNARVLSMNYPFAAGTN
jgi:hypothetical protein